MTRLLVQVQVQVQERELELELQWVPIGLVHVM
jgi:hypothetical protein